MVTFSVFRRASRLHRLMTFHRIHITGNAGSGKTSAARYLSDALAIPAYSLDTIVWQPHWKKTPPAERLRKEQALTSQPTWIIEGVSDHVRSTADLVIYLDPPRHKCLWRALRRGLRHLVTQRPEFPDDCPEWKILPALARIIWRFQKLVVHKIELEARHDPDKYWIFHSDKGMQMLLRRAGTARRLHTSTMSDSVDTRRGIAG